MIDRPPAISVLMAAHNAGSYIAEAVDSLLGQTFSNFELLVVDDGSTDETPTVLHSFRDPRLRVLRNESNQGLPISLNRGLAACRAPLIARADADDVYLPQRLERQFAYMELHPDLAILGTGSEWIGPNLETIAIRNPPAATPGILFWETTWTCPLLNPSIIVRADWFDRLGGYDERFIYSQDYDFLARLLETGGKAAILPEIHVRYRRHESQISTARAAAQMGLALEVAERYIRWMLQEEVSAEQIRLMQSIFYPEIPLPSAKEAGAATRLLKKILGHCASRVTPKEWQQIRERSAIALAQKAKQHFLTHPAASLILAKAALLCDSFALTSYVSRTRLQRAAHPSPSAPSLARLPLLSYVSPRREDKKIPT